MDEGQSAIQAIAGVGLMMGICWAWVYLLLKNGPRDESWGESKRRDAPSDTNLPRRKTWTS